MAGIQETVDVLDFVTAALKDVAEAKEGGLSGLEVIKLAIANAPAAVKAAAGADQIPAEMKDLDKAELQVLAQKGLDLSKAVMALFSKA